MMSLQATLSNSNSIPDSSNASRSFATSFSGQSASTPVFHHSGTMQGLQNFHGSFNTANIPGSLASRSSALSGVPSTGVQQPSGGLPTGRFTSNNLPVALSQLPHGGLHGPSGVSNRGSMSVTGSPAFNSSTNGVGPSGPGIPPTSVSIGNRNAVPGLGVLGNNAPRLANSISSMVGTGSVGRNMNFGGGLGMPTMASRMNLTGNSGAGNLNVPQNRLMSGVLPQGPQMMSMLGNSYSSFGGPLGQNQIHTGNNALNSISMSNDMNSNEGAPFDINDFPQLTGRPSSAGGPQGQLGSLRKQGVGVSSIVQPSQEFSIQNEDFPALPGFKGGNTEFPMDLHQKEVHHENAFSMMQPQHFPVARSSGFGLTGSYTSQRQQQQQQQHLPSISSSGVSYAAAGSPDLLHMHGSDLFSSSHGMSGSYHSQVQNVGAPNLGVRSMNASNAAGMGSYDPFIKQYQQHHQSQPQFRLQQALPVTQSYRDQNMKLLSGMQAPPDPFGLLGLLSVIRMNDPDLTSLALGIDLTTLGLNLNSRESLYKTFGSPWSDAPTKGEPEYNLPQCYIQAAPWLQPGHFSRFRTETLFYIFYSMPNDEAQLFAANELHNQGWFFHRELRQWILKVSNSEALSKTHSLERGTYLVFDPNNWETVRKDNFIVAHEQLEKRPVVPQH